MPEADVAAGAERPGVHKEATPESNAHKINTAPNPKVIVRAGDDAYFSADGVDPVPIAICELIDNSLSAIRQRKSDGNKGVIHVRYEQRVNGKAVVSVWDNGCGMSLKTLEEFATFAYSPEDRAKRDASTAVAPPTLTVEPWQVEFYNNPMRINAKMNKFGVGAKMSAFFIGNEMTMVTKDAQSSKVLEYQSSSDEMYAKYQAEGAACYDQETISRSVGNCEVSKLKKNYSQFDTVRELINDETNHASFSYVVIGDVKVDKYGKFSDAYGEKMAIALSEVYCKYLHPDPVIKSGLSGFADILFTCNTRTWNLRDIANYQTELVAKGRSRFSCWGLNWPMKQMFFIDLSYFPFDEFETVPNRAAAGMTHVAPPVDGGDDDENGEALATSPSPDQVLWCFWQGDCVVKTGRLISSRVLGPFDFMKNICGNLQLAKGRFKGNLYVDGEFSVTSNKSSFTGDLMQQLNDKGVVWFVCDDKAGPVESAARAQRVAAGGMAITDKFTAWVTKCNMTFDKEVSFEGKLPLNEQPQFPPSIMYASASVAGKTFKSGDIIHIESGGKKAFEYGRILWFQRRTNGRSYGQHQDHVKISGSEPGDYCRVVQLPEFAYPPPEPKKTSKKEPKALVPGVPIILHYIDKKMSSEDVLAGLERCRKEKMQMWPARMDFVYHDRTGPSATEAAGYTFPNIVLTVSGHQSASGAAAKLRYVPGTKTKLSMTQTIRRAGAEVIVFEKTGPVSDKKDFQFWEVGNKTTNPHFVTEGDYTVTFSLANYSESDPVIAAKLVKTISFTIIAGASVGVHVSDDQAPMRLQFGAPTREPILFYLIDEFGNKCSATEDVMARLSVRHKQLVLTGGIFTASVSKQVQLKTVIANPLRFESGLYAGTDLAKIDALEVLLLQRDGEPLLLGTIPVVCLPGDAFSAVWAPDASPSASVVSGKLLPSFSVQLLDKFGTPSGQLGTIQAVTISLEDKASTLDGRNSHKITTFNSTGLITLPPMRLNSALPAVTLLARIARKKTKQASIDQAPLLSAQIIVVPGNAIGRVEFALSDLMEDDSKKIQEVMVASTHDVRVHLYRENNEPFPVPYDDRMLGKISFVFLDGEVHQLTPDGILKGVVTFPSAMRSAPFPVGMVCTVDQQGDGVVGDSRIQTLTAQQRFRLAPGRGVNWRVTFTDAIHCGVPIGEALRITLQDQYTNPVELPLDTLPSVTFCNKVQVCGDPTPMISADGQTMTLPDIFFKGAPQADIGIYIDNEARAKFELEQGPPHHLVLAYQNLHYEQQEEGSVIEVNVSPLQSRCQVTLQVSASDISGIVANVPIDFKLECDCLVNKRAIRQTKLGPSTVQFELSLHVPNNLADVLFIITALKPASRGEALFAPMKCSFPVTPWRERVATVSIDPVPESVLAGVQVPTITGRLLNDQGTEVDVDSAVISNSLSLTLTERDSKGDISGDFYLLAEAIAPGRFQFPTRADSLTKAGVYEFKLCYVESRDNVVKFLKLSEKEVTSAALMSIVAESPKRILAADGQRSLTETESSSAIPKLIELSLVDNFGNAAAGEFTSKDIDDLVIDIQSADASSPPVLSVLTSPVIVVSPTRTILTIGDLRLKPSPTVELGAGLYTLSFRLLSRPSLEPGTISFFHSANAHDSVVVKNLLDRQQKLKADILRVQNTLTPANTESDEAGDEVDLITKRRRDLLSKYYSSNWEGSPERVLFELEQKRKELETNVARQTIVLNTSNERKAFSQFPSFLCILGDMALCTSEADSKVISHVLGQHLRVPIFQTVDDVTNKKLTSTGKPFFALDFVRQLSRPCDKWWERVSNKPWRVDPRRLVSLVTKAVHTDPILFERMLENLAGNFIVMQSIGDAGAFRRYAVKHNLNCPTILTYDGCTIQNNGMSGRKVNTLNKNNCMTITPLNMRADLDKCLKQITDIQEYQALAKKETTARENLAIKQAFAQRLTNQFNDLNKELDVVDAEIEKTIPATGSSSRKRRRVLTSKIGPKGKRAAIINHY